MQRVMLRAKLHRVTVTQADLNYEGSCGIDMDLLEAADILPNEHIDLYNVNNGERFHTYIILAEPGSGTFSMNGAAARKVAVGDRVIIATYGHFTEAELINHKPKLVYLNEDNTVNRTTNTIPMQVA